jgi:hypothetical protein
MNKNSTPDNEFPHSRWPRKKTKIYAGGGLTVLLFVLSYVTALIVATGPVTTYRMLTNGDSTIETFKIFPYRTIATAEPVSALKTQSLANFPTTINFSYLGNNYNTTLVDLFAHTDTQAFIVIRNDTVIYESYLDGANRDTLFTSFSMAKSFTSALIGIAIDQGKIKSISDPVIQYIPELKGRGFDSLTIRDMLLMSTGVGFWSDENLFPLLVPFSDNAKHTIPRICVNSY